MQTANQQVPVGVYPDGEIKYKCASRGYTAWWQRKTYFTFMTSYILVVPAMFMTFCYVNVVLVVWKRSRELTSEVTVSGSQDSLTKNVVVYNERNDINPRAALRRSTSWRTSSFALRKLRSVDSSDGNESGSGRAHSQGGSSVQLRRSVSDSRSMFRARTRTVQLTLCIVCLFIACWTPYFVVHLVHIWSEYRQQIPERIYVFAETLALVNSAVNPLLYGCFHAKLCKQRHRTRNQSSLTRWSSVQSSKTSPDKNHRVKTTAAGDERTMYRMNNWSRFTDAATHWRTADNNIELNDRRSDDEDSQLTKTSESRLTRSGRVVTFLPENGASYDSRYNW